TIKLTTVLQIEKLCGISNYHTWRSLAMTFLHIMGVADIIFGDIPRPAKASSSGIDRTTVNDLPTWELASHRTKGFIIVNIDSSLLPLIAQCPDAPSAWKALEERFDRKTTASMHLLVKSVLT